MSASPHAPPELDERLRALGLELRRTLADLLEPLTGPDPRPADIGEVLGIDRTQSWRISRVLLTDDPYAILHETPAPKGLALIVDAAERAGAPTAAARAMRQSIAAFAGLLHEFPDGRAGLEGALSSRVPRAEEASLKAARKKITQGMGQLLGLRAAVRYVASILVPSPGHEALADVVAVAGYRDLRRMRIGPSPVVFSGRTYTRLANAAAPALVTLEGADDPDPRLRLLDDFSELTPEALSLEQSGEELRLVLMPDQPAVNEPITMFFAQRVARSLDRSMAARGPGDPRHEIVHHAPVLPSDVNVFDTLIHRDLFPSADPPAVTLERFGFNPARQVGKPDDAAYRVDSDIDTRRLGWGVRRATVRAVPRLPELLETVFRRIGEDPQDYRMYRTTMEHVPPGFAVVVWIELPPGSPADTPAGG